MRERRLFFKVAALKKNGTTIRFGAKLSRPEKTEKAVVCFLTLPKGASEDLPSRGDVKVEGTINGFPFRRALEPDKNGSLRLSVNEAMLGGAGAEAGEDVTVEITRVGEEPEIRAPMELSKALAGVPKAAAMWDTITPMARQNWILWICSGKLEETRLVRIEKACDMLASGKKRVCCFGGLNWLLKDYGTSGGVWQPLPKSKKDK